MNVSLVVNRMVNSLPMYRMRVSGTPLLTYFACICDVDLSFVVEPIPNDAVTCRNPDHQRSRQPCDHFVYILFVFTLYTMPDYVDVLFCSHHFTSFTVCGTPTKQRFHVSWETFGLCSGDMQLNKLTELCKNRH